MSSGGIKISNYEIARFACIAINKDSLDLPGSHHECRVQEFPIVPVNAPETINNINTKKIGSNFVIEANKILKCTPKVQYLTVKSK